MKKKFSLCIARELFKLSDGGTIGIDWVDNIPKKNSENPILVIIPGISGNNDEQYILNTIKEAHKYGYQCVIINYRSGSGIKLTVSKFNFIFIYRVHEPIQQRVKMILDRH